MLYFVVVLLVAGLAAAGWFIVEQQQALAEAQAALVSADERLKRLEDRLALTDRALTGQGSALKDQIALWEREARRAWQVAYKQNRPRIEALETSLETVQSKLSTQGQTLAEVRSELARQQGLIGSQQQLVERLTELELKLVQVQNGQRDLTDSVNAARTLISALDARMESHDEAIRSMDAFRVQTNRTLAELRAQSGSGMNPPPAQ